MTAPFPLEPPKSFDGISPRELLSAERVVDDGEETLPPLGPGKPAVVSVAIHAHGYRRLLRQPEDAADYGFLEVWYDSSWANQMRIVARVRDVGAANAELFSERSPDATAWTEPGVSAEPVTVLIDAPGPRKSVAWVDLPTASRADLKWRVRARGGDGVLSPDVGEIHLQFRQATATRPPIGGGDPLGTPIHDLNALTLRDIVGLADNADVALWPDDSVSELDATCAGSPSFPKYRATLWPGGLPCVRWTGNAAPLLFGPPTNSAFSHYIVASGINGGDVANILLGNGYPRGKGVSAIGTTQIGGFVNTHAFFPTFQNVNDTWDMSVPHIYRFVFALGGGLGRWYLFVDGVCVTFEGGNPGVSCPPQVTESTVMSLCDNLGGLGMDALIARELCYDVASTTEGLNAIETALKATWGTP